MSGAEIPIMVGMTVLSTAMQANAQKQAGSAAAAQGLAEQQGQDYQALELQQQAQQVRGQATHQAEITSRDNAIALSNGRARVAASGTTTTSPGVVNTLGQAAGRGAYNVESALATGEEHARALEGEAQLRTYQGTEAAAAGSVRRSAANTAALGTIFAGAGSLYAKYGVGA